MHLFPRRNTPAPKSTAPVDLLTTLIETHNSYLLPENNTPVVILIELLAIHALKTARRTPGANMCRHVRRLITTIDNLLKPLTSAHNYFFYIQNELKFFVDNPDNVSPEQLSAFLPKMTALDELIQHHRHWHEPCAVTIPFDSARLFELFQTKNFPLLKKKNNTSIDVNNVSTSSTQSFDDTKVLISKKQLFTWTTQEKETIRLSQYDFSLIKNAEPIVNDEILSFLDTIVPTTSKVYTALSTAYNYFSTCLHALSRDLIACYNASLNYDTGIETVVTTLILLATSPRSLCPLTHITKLFRGKLSSGDSAVTAITSKLAQRHPYNAMYMLQLLFDPISSLKATKFLQLEVMAPGFQPNTVLKLSILNLIIAYNIIDLLVMLPATHVRIPAKTYHALIDGKDIIEPENIIQDENYAILRAHLQKSRILISFRNNFFTRLTQFPTPTKAFRLELASYLLIGQQFSLLECSQVAIKLTQKATLHHLQVFMHTVIKSNAFGQGQILYQDSGIEFFNDIFETLNFKFRRLGVIWINLVAYFPLPAAKLCMTSLIIRNLLKYYKNGTNDIIIKNAGHTHDKNGCCRHCHPPHKTETEPDDTSEDYTAAKYKNINLFDELDLTRHSFHLCSSFKQKFLGHTGLFLPKDKNDDNNGTIVHDKKTAMMTHSKTGKTIMFDPTNSLPYEVIVPPPIISKPLLFSSHYTPITAISPGTIDNIDQVDDEFKYVMSGTSQRQTNSTNNTNTTTTTTKLFTTTPKRSPQPIDKHCIYDQSNHLVGDTIIHHDDIRFTAYTMRLLFQDLITMDVPELLPLCVNICEPIFPHVIPHVPFLDFKNNHAALCYALRRGAKHTTHYLILEYKPFHRNTRPSLPPPLPRRLLSPKHYNIDLNSLTPLHAISMNSVPRGCRLHGSEKCSWCQDIPLHTPFEDYIALLPPSYINAIMEVSDKHIYGNPLNFGICQGNHAIFELFPHLPLDLNTFVNDIEYLIRRFNEASIYWSLEGGKASDYQRFSTSKAHSARTHKLFLQTAGPVTVDPIKGDPTCLSCYSLYQTYYLRASMEDMMLSNPAHRWRTVHHIEPRYLGDTFYENFNPFEGLITDPDELKRFKHTRDIIQIYSPHTEPFQIQQEFHFKGTLHLVQIPNRLANVLKTRPEYNQMCIKLATDALTRTPMPVEQLPTYNVYKCFNIVPGAIPMGICERFDLRFDQASILAETLITMIATGYQLMGVLVDE